MKPTSALRQRALTAYRSHSGTLWFSMLEPTPVDPYGLKGGQYVDVRVMIDHLYSRLRRHFALGSRLLLWQMPQPETMTADHWRRCLRVKRYNRWRLERQQRREELREIVRRKVEEDAAVYRMEDEQKRKQRSMPKVYHDCYLADCCVELLAEMRLLAS